MRTKLFLLLILSSLTSLSYSQKLNQEDFQGLWYKIYSYKNFDSIYNLKFKKIQFEEPIYYDTLWICCTIDSNKKSDSLNIDWTSSIIDLNNPDDRGERIFIMDDVYPFEAFEIKKKEIIFFENLYESNLVYTYRERKIKNNNSENADSIFNNQYLFKTNYILKDNFLFVRQFNTDIWSKNEILHFSDDTLILRNSKQNFYDVYVRKKIDNEINYKISVVSFHQTFCFGSCPSFDLAISYSGKIFLNYKDGSYNVNMKKKNGVYFYKITQEEFADFFSILKYLNLNKIEKTEYSTHPHDSRRKLKFSLGNMKEIEFKDFTDYGPVELRILNQMIYNLVNNIVNKRNQN